MTDQSVFSNTAPASTSVDPAAPAAPVAQPNPLDTLLDQIRNEQGVRKYADPVTALNALKTSQEYIPQLQSKLTTTETELAALKAELAKRESVEEVLARIQSTTAQSQTTENTHSAGLDEQTVQALIQRTIQNTEAQKLALSNERSVNESLIAKFGDKAKEVVAAKAAELGISLQDLGNLSQRSPKAVLAYFDVKHNQFPAPNTSSVNTAAFQPKTIQDTVARPEKSILQGRTNKEIAEHLNEHKRAVYQRLGVEA